MQKAIDMLSEVKESIMNAYEIKSGLSRNKISKLMDAETWMNAKEAKKLGFADEILFTDGTEPNATPRSLTTIRKSRCFSPERPSPTPCSRS
jgi:ATP-dependent Clp protease protease subunit